MKTCLERRIKSLVIILTLIGLVLANTTIYSSDSSENAYNSEPEPKPEDHPCEKKTGMLIKYLLGQKAEVPPEISKDFSKFALYSGTGINDWGDYRSCKKLESANYKLISYTLWLTEALSTNINLGFCFFKECDIEYLDKVKVDIALILKETRNITVNTTNLVFIDPDSALEGYKERSLTGFIVVMSVLGVFIFMNFLQCYMKARESAKKTVIYDVDEERKSNKSFLENNKNIKAPEEKKEMTKFQKIMQFFDFSKNVNKIFEVNNLNPTYEALRIFDGVRFLSTGWVVWGHSESIPLSIGAKNILDVPELSKTWRFSILLSALYSVDVFFYMSAFLLYFSLQKVFNKKISKFTLFFSAIIHRYIRLLPLYLFAILGIVFIIPYIGSGPIYFIAEKVNSNCNTLWWHNLLYFNNIYKYENGSSMCAGHTWYLANDMQFFILSILIFFFLNNHKYIRNIIFTLIFIASNVGQILIVFKYNFRYAEYSRSIPSVGADWFNDYYIKPWNRICPYVLGLYFCEFFLETPVYRNDYIIVTDDDEEQDGKTETYTYIRRINEYLVNNNTACFILFVISIILINVTVFTPVLINRVELSLTTHAIIITFHKVFFVFGLGCIIHLTFLGKFTFVRDLLSFKLFTVVGRITYGIYLVHIFLVIWYYFSNDSQSYMKMGDLTFGAIGIFSVSGVISLLLSVILESPVINLIKYLTEDGNRGKNNIKNKK